MPDVRWFYPKTITEAEEIIERENATPHAGGTGLLMRGLNKYSLVDLHSLNLRYIEDKGDNYMIGAMATYSDCAAKLPDELILTKAAGSAASTPLRNRITVGGSLAMAPVWSDIIGPMVAYGAKIKITGEAEAIPIEQYLKNSDIRKGSIIEYVRLPKSNVCGYYHRETRTKFDYPMFTLSLIAKEMSAKFIITGIKTKFARLDDIEEAYMKDGHIEDTIEKLELEFPSKMQANPEYLSKVAKVEILRGIRQLKGVQS